MPTASHAQTWAWLFAGTTFLSAFLLFLVQPMVGRLLLPTYGGAPAVWTMCLVFFQGTLFLGYLWSHAAPAKLQQRAHNPTHVGLAIIACLAMPFAPPTGVAGEWHVLAWLGTQVGLPFAVLATTAPTLQRWWTLLTDKEPYHLYAVSNAGSLLALVIYPLAVEPNMNLQTQQSVWAWLFRAFVVGLCVCAARVWRCRPAVTLAVPTVRQSGGWGRRVLWLCLSAVPSVMLLAVTNHITIDVASGPMLWVLPLFVYLLSFVLVFGPMSHRWQPAWLVVWLVALVALGMNLFLAGQTTMLRQVLVGCTALFSCSVLCHGELVRHRPAPCAITSFYLWMSAGGALGGVFAGLVAPRIFSGFFELQLGVVATLVVLLVSFRIGTWTRGRGGMRLLFLGLGIGVPLMAASVWLGTVTQFKGATVISRRRGFFGLVQVTRFADFTVLTHGRIRHGMQWNDPARQSEATMYFAPTTAVGKILLGLQLGRSRSIGILGLGIGTLATYGRPDDHLWFYEIDPIVAQAADEQFSYLKNAPSHIHVVVGDGRAALAQHPTPLFDVLVLDAFSSDAVPTHLLTAEAFELYARKLTPDGIIVANVSNRHLQVERVVAGAAARLGWEFGLYETYTDLSRGVSKVRWAVVARSSATFAPLVNAPSLPTKGPVLWTDQRSSVLSILRPVGG